jgi:hypothetical protein
METGMETRGREGCIKGLTVLVVSGCCFVVFSSVSKLSIKYISTYLKYICKIILDVLKAYLGIRLPGRSQLRSQTIGGRPSLDRRWW